MSIFMKTAEKDATGREYSIEAFGPGFWLWIIAIGLAFLASVIAMFMGREQRVINK
jgi:hypothetical protein